MSDAWYKEAAPTVKITQGDLISDCPVMGWKPEPIAFQAGNEREAFKGAFQTIRASVVVMNQACDLENDKVRDVILCPHQGLSEFKLAWEKEKRSKGENPTIKAWVSFCNDMKDGYCWNLSLLNEGSTDTLNIEHRVVSFNDVYTIPRTFLESLLVQIGKPRLQLQPPYREHLSQAFARFFMRVGLPVGITPAW